MLRLHSRVRVLFRELSCTERSKDKWLTFKVILNKKLWTHHYHCILNHRLIVIDTLLKVKHIAWPHNVSLRSWEDESENRDWRFSSSPFYARDGDPDQEHCQDDIKGWKKIALRRGWHLSLPLLKRLGSSSGEQPFAPTKRCALRANSRSPLQEEYDSEYDHRSGKSVTASSHCSWRESVSITSPDAPPGITSSRQRASLLLLRYPRPKTRDTLLIFLFSLFLSLSFFLSLSKDGSFRSATKNDITPME